MSLTALIVALGLVVLFVAPFVIAMRNSRGKSKKVAEEFAQIASSNGINIKETDAWRLRIIGIDSDSKKLVYIDRDHKNINPQIIDISQINSSSIYKATEAQLAADGSNTQVVNALGIQIALNDGKNIKLSFYDAAYDNYHEMGEMTFKAERWIKKINATK
ncbi:MAG: hypothetical protein LWX70_04640 [Sphingobacteriia bacterium]|nr:hypothetical protein [Sphingobacteriia bacterium]